MKNYLTICLVSLLVLSCAAAPSGQTGSIENEVLIQQIPQDWHEVTFVQQDNMSIKEVIPKDQDINSWEEILSTEIIAGGIDVSVEAFIQNLNKSWALACPQVSTKPAIETVENGYTSYFWLQTCHTSHPSTPKMTLFKAIQGEENFYLIQKSWRGNLTPESVKFWSLQMKAMQLCNSSLTGESCLSDI
ncbi:hypothetical protein [Reinekea marinisedimentorum]|uniref:CNP1-like family protein n=1 Tax=Reinekea marinisedimentorum TaxID=230495 RepID=A0A4R3I6C2_9GAMM|nr:hypothetical protein [Reinekea marinisedimentorum]TCS41625.1 hypothetical protein BCF53_10552 [Reinekea marinisedimentorum]